MSLCKKRLGNRSRWPWAFGLIAFVWVLLRSGTNLKRLTYPCRWAAMPIAVNWLLTVTAFLAGSLFLRRFARLCGVGILLVGTIWFIGVFPEFTRSGR
jgi:hypothetical protein